MTPVLNSFSLIIHLLVICYSKIKTAIKSRKQIKDPSNLVRL